LTRLREDSSRGPFRVKSPRASRQIAPRAPSNEKMLACGARARARIARGARETSRDGDDARS
jgi:hypothetical protein